MSKVKYPNDKTAAELKNQFEKIIPIAPDFINIKPISLSELKAILPQPMEYVIFPILPTQGICFIYAATGIGKTLFALNLAYAISGGGNFLKYACPKSRKVLYIDGEMAFPQVHNRIISIMKSQGIIDNEENFSLFTPDKILPQRMPKMDTKEGQNFYEKFLIDNGYDCVFFDNLSMLSSFDENKSEEWKVIQDWLLLLRSKGICSIVIHHSGKDKNGYRGTSRMLDCADTAISLQAINSDDLEDENIKYRKFKVEYQKCRHFGGSDALPYEVNLQNGFWNFKSIEQTNIDRVVERINSGMSQTAIAKELLVSQPYVNKLVKKARISGALQK